MVSKNLISLTLNNIIYLYFIFSRIQPRLLGYEGPASDPIMPPTNEMKSIRLFDDSRDSTQLITSPVSTSSAPRLLMRSRIFSDSSGKFFIQFVLTLFRGVFTNYVYKTR